jgi:alanine racemase
MHSLMRRAWVEVDLGALLRNGVALMARAGKPLLPMVKADAYGLGAVRVARTLQRLNPWGFGVATIAEGEALRRASVEGHILVFTPLLPGDFDAAVRAELTPTLGSAEAINQWAITRRPWQLAIDTGMSRAGVPWNEVRLLHDAIVEHPPEGAFTHFHSAERDDSTRDEQERRFAAALADLPMKPPLLHAENGAAVEHRAPSPWDIIRPGIFLYGVGSGHHAALEPDLVVSVRARVVDIRRVPQGDTVSYDGTYRAASDRRIATVAVGYADGYPRALSNRGVVLVHGRRAPVVGLVTMDMTMIDVTDLRCELGDKATLLGADGVDRLSVSDVAASANLSPYELLTGLNGRMPRRYVEERS